MRVDRMLPTEEAYELLALVRELCDEELALRAAQAAENGPFPREEFRTIGRAGLIDLPYREEDGGGGQPYEVYLQMLEEIAAAWMIVGVGVSVHTMTSYGLATYGDDEQKARLLPEMAGGELLGGYALSEAQAG